MSVNVMSILYRIQFNSIQFNLIGLSSDLIICSCDLIGPYGSFIEYQSDLFGPQNYFIGRHSELIGLHSEQIGLSLASFGSLNNLSLT